MVQGAALASYVLKNKDDISLVGLHCRQESGLTFSMLLIVLPLSNSSLAALVGMLPMEWRKCIHCVRASQNPMTGGNNVKRLETRTFPTY